MDFYFLTERNDAPPIRSTAPSPPKALSFIRTLCGWIELLFPKLRKHTWAFLCQQPQIWLVPYLISISCNSAPKSSAQQRALIKELEADNKAQRDRIATLREHRSNKKAEIADLKERLRKEEERSASLGSKLADHNSIKEMHNLLVEILDRIVAQDVDIKARARQQEQ